MNGDDPILGRNDMLAPTLPPSLPPESKVTLQLALCVVLGALILIAFAAAVLHVDSGPFWSVLSTAAGGVLGLLTGGNRR